jgi:hypothetical protein
VKRNQDIVVANNIVTDNNMPNLSDGEGMLELLPRGIGIMVMGSQRVAVRSNKIEVRRSSSRRSSSSSAAAAAAHADAAQCILIL